MSIRPATEQDLPSLTDLADTKRTEYAQYAPTFWRKAAGGVEQQTHFFAALLKEAATITLVSEEAGTINGFVIARVLQSPPVYAPGSLVCWIDDFTVAAPGEWETVGAALLQAARRRAEERGVRLTAVICGHLDEPKRRMLRAAGFAIAAET